jgi:two-component system response regulator
MNMMDLDAVEVLLVEDNPQDAELTIRALKRHHLANQLVHVEDGAEALDFLFARGKYEGLKTDRPPRVVLLDLKLPKMNGLEVLRIMKTSERTRSIPVVVVTASAEDPDVRTAYELGVNSYVIKPVQFEAFMEAMSKLGIYWLMINRPMK